MRKQKQMGGTRGTWRGEMLTDGQSESHNGYTVDIKDLEADQERDGAST